MTTTTQPHVRTTGLAGTRGGVPQARIDAVVFKRGDLGWGERVGDGDGCAG